MKKAMFCAAMALMSLGALATSSMAATLVVNGSFEDDPGVASTTSGTGYAVYPSLPGWTTSSGNGIELQSASAIGFPAEDGNVYAELDTSANSDIMQTLTLGVGPYVLSFFYSPRSQDPATNPIDYSLGSIFSDSVTGPGGPYQVGTWTEVTKFFDVALAGTYKLAFAAGGTSDGYGGLIDNISITPSAVPLPAGGILLLCGMGAFAFLRRKKHDSI